MHGLRVAAKTEEAARAQRAAVLAAAAVRWVPHDIDAQAVAAPPLEPAADATQATVVGVGADVDAPVAAALAALQG